MGDTKSNINTTRIRIIQAKQVLRFFCLFIIIYGLLITPWPGLGAAYSKFYRTGVIFLFAESFGSSGVVHFRESGDVIYDLNICIYNRDRADTDGNVEAVLEYQSSHYAGYMPTVFIISLIAASPICLRRRGWALLWGLILIHVFIAFKLAVIILNHFVNNALISLFVLNLFWKKVLSLAAPVLANSISLSFVVSVFIWVLVSFRREDWGRILMRGNDLSNKMQ